jgi:hypothetical protein
LFIRDFNKLRLLSLSLGSVLFLYAALSISLETLAQWAEIHQNSYPWKHEDYLRCLIPDLFKDEGNNRILLTGPSEARESFIYEQFEQEFPHFHAFQASQSLGTFDDLLLTLEYIRDVYGRKAMPSILVLGITLRFVANIPRERSPLVAAINRYSPFYRVEQSFNGPSLIKKDRWEGFLSRVRFLSKQQPRYLVAFATLLHYLLKENLPYKEFEREIPRMRPLHSALNLREKSGILAALKYAQEVGLATYLGRWLRLYISPYRYHHRKPLQPEVLKAWLEDPNSFWFKGHVWNPKAEGQMVHTEFARLLEITRRWGTELYVVNLPEHEWNRKEYKPEYYNDYMKLVREALGSTPFLNLRTMLEPEEFFDVGHPTLSGAFSVTNRVIEFIKEYKRVSKEGINESEQMEIRRISGRHRGSF